ncbi:MAG: rod shape-determining protein RodA [Coriobacteriales bacterium]|jgi:rod shape determining protein RodA|nr:rod shape-determining protein RodA [Coriobacteriales bacterium]
MQTGMHARVGAGSMSASRVGAGQRSLVRRFLHQANLPLILVVGLLTSYGLLVVNVAIVGSADYAFSKQLFGVGIGMVLLVLLWIFDYRKLAPFMIPLLIIDVILLLSPMIPGVGLSVNGARSWVVIFGQQFQPGEPAKIITIVYLAAMVSRYQGKINSGREYIKVLALSLIPVAGIMTQPDLGSGMVLFVIAMVILFTGGANRKWLLLTIAIIIAMIVSVLAFDSALDDYFGYDVLLKDYQKNRLLVFLDENLDPDGAGYNLKQAKIAIGSGGFMGKGIGNATQSGLGFLPEAPTDFIFCVLAETFGFVGSVALIVLYTALLLLTLRVAIMVNDRFGTLIATGTIGMWLFQIFENIGMDCGLMPITGIPLPFMSYGSSFMVVNFMALGLIFSIYRKRDEK